MARWLVAIGFVAASGATVVHEVTGGDLNWAAGPLRTIDSVLGFVQTAYVTVDHAKTMDVTMTRPLLTGNPSWIVRVLQFRNSNGVGNTGVRSSAVTGIPDDDLATTQPNSAMVLAILDTNAVVGTSRVWKTFAGGLTDLVYERQTSVPIATTSYLAYHPDVVAKADYIVGLNAPTGQMYGMVELEVKGRQNPEVKMNISFPRVSSIL